MTKSSAMLLAAIALSCAIPVTTIAQTQQNAASASQISTGDPVDKLGDNLMRVFQDSQSNYWFATWDNGVYRTDGKEILHFTTKHGLSHQRVEEVAEDAAGNLYLSTTAGVDKFDGKQFSRIPIAPASQWMQEPDDIWFICPQFSGRVCRFDGKMLHQLTLPKLELGEQYLAKNPNVPNPYAVYTIYRDQQKHIWFGTAALGACRFDGRKFDWISSDDVNELHNGPANGVRSIVQDGQGLFWFTTRYRYGLNGRGANGLTPIGDIGPFLRYSGIGSLDGRQDGGFHEYMSIVTDDDGGIWMATYGGGVYHFDGQAIKHFPIMNGDQVVTLFSIYKDRDGTIWLGTHENGAYRFDGSKFVRFEVGK